MQQIQANLDQSSPLITVQQRINQACVAAGRNPNSVKLLAVSKTFGLDRVLELAAQGQLAFGENYVQEAVEKHQAWQLTGMPRIEWHFIGPLQSNKTRPIAQTFDWVHSIDRIKIAQRLSEQRPSHLEPLQVCLQVNVSQEASKSGCLPSEALALAQVIAPLPGLQLRGLMALPEAPSLQASVTDSLATQYRSMASLFEQLKMQIGPHIDTLSMGMSADLEAAIAHGSTMVRVGSALFGQRK